MTDLDEGEVGYDRFDLFDDFWLGACTERFKLHVEDCLFFRFGGYFFLAHSCIVCACSCSAGWKCGACGGEGDFLDVQTRLYVMLWVGCMLEKEELWNCFFFGGGGAGTLP